MYKEWHKEYHGLDTIELGDSGFVTFQTGDMTAHVHDFFIKESERNEGRGSVLLVLLKKHFKELGVTQVYFDVQKWNTNKQYVFRIAQRLSEDNAVYEVHDKYMVNL